MQRRGSERARPNVFTLPSCSAYCASHNRCYFPLLPMCLSDVTTNKGPYIAIVNENACQPTEQSQTSGSSSDGQGSGSAQVVSLKTLGMNSTRPTEVRARISSVDPDPSPPQLLPSTAAIRARLLSLPARLRSDSTTGSA